ncbi:MAG: FtsX-like permease family protein [Putridiphycobacter sp.]|nr:FtsX-like permease family protein [Putridiphycobacter sp.]
MKTIIKIAWRNVWRNRLRSGVVFGSVVIGIWAGLFVVAMSQGMLAQQKRGMLESQISNIQIHADSYLADPKLENCIPPNELANIETVIASAPEVKHFVKRSITMGTGTTASGFSNLKIMGIDPEKEKETTTISERLLSGSYFTTFKNKPVLIGRELADELNLEVGKSLNLSFQNINGEFVQAGFKVEGIFATPSLQYDKSNLFILQSDFMELVEADAEMIHEYAIVIDDLEKSTAVSESINQKINGAKAQDWAEIAPDISYMDEASELGQNIILVIIVFALAFGIVNTMLMAVLERKRELGMLLCIGMNKTSVFLMIMIETICLSVIAAPIGLMLAWGTITYFGIVGINLESVGDALYKAGIDSMVFTAIDPWAYVTITIFILIASIIAAIVPARKALKYNPAEAVRAV